MAKNRIGRFADLDDDEYCAEYEKMLIKNDGVIRFNLDRLLVIIIKKLANIEYLLENK